MKKNEPRFSMPSSSSKPLTLSPSQADSLHEHFKRLESHFRSIADILDEAELENARLQDIRNLIARLKSKYPDPGLSPEKQVIQFDSIEDFVDYINRGDA